MSDAPNLSRLISAGTDRRVIATRDYTFPLDGFVRASSLGPSLMDLEARSVILVVRDMAKAAAALIDLDGCARRIVLCPPGWDVSRLASAARDSDVDALVYDDEDAPPPIPVDVVATCGLPLRELNSPRPASHETEWILPTSGTSGPPKLVVHTLRSLTGAIADAPPRLWATFYDIRRYGGLQIFLRALSSRSSLYLGAVEESVLSILARFGDVGVTHISGTPSHWRKVLMSGAGRRVDPDYVRLSGEIADSALLSALRALYPRAAIEHAYASTEAGVVFAVNDGKAGFPASWLERDGSVQMKIVDGSLRVRSNWRAMRFLGENTSPLADEDGFVDTGDIVEWHGDRLYFVGRRGGIINVGGAKVHPEEVEAVLNAHAAVRASRAFARTNSITGALVFAEVVLRDEHRADAACESDILGACRARLPRHMVPAGLRFVSDLPITEGGKLARRG